MGTRQIQADFDQLATYSAAGWNHNAHYHGYLLGFLRHRAERALEIGCGSGRFARELAHRADTVHGIDLSPRMLDAATSQTPPGSHIRYQLGDFMSLNLPRNHYDVIATIATLHHMPFAPALQRIKDLLRPGGMLLALDLYESATLADKLVDVAAVPANFLLTRLRSDARPATPEERAAWQAHGDSDHYLTLADLRAYYERILPGTRLTRHLLWRYSAIWRKP